MLYATTRDSETTYEVKNVLSGKSAPDGGFFVPYRPPYFYQSNLKNLRELPFLQVEAKLLNTLFGTELTDWDLTLGAGKDPVKIMKFGRRTITCERWRNTDFTFSGYVRQIAELLGMAKGETPSSWTEIGVGISLLFASFLEIQKSGLLPQGESLDVAVRADSLNAAVSCLYAKAWGLPVGRVICSLRESKGLWQLIHDGEMHTDVLEPGSRQVKDLENLLLVESYQAEVRRFLDCVKRGRTYVPADSLLRRLREDIGVSIISKVREEDTIPAVFTTKNYLISLDGAGAYAGLMDYRASAGAGNKGLVLCDAAPDQDLQLMTEKLHMDENSVIRLLTKIS